MSTPPIALPHALRHVLFAVAALFAATTGALPRERTAAAAPTEMVTVEAIELRGDASVTRDWLEATLGVGPGKVLAREELDAALAEAERRLGALGFFRAVDLRLAKGTRRGHYRVIVTLEAQSAYYGGLDLQQRRTRSLRAPVSATRSNTEEVYFGSRGVGPQGFGFELSVSRDLGRTTESHVDDGYDNRITKAAGYWPDIFGTPYFAWLLAQYEDSSYSSAYDYDYAPYGYYHSRNRASGSSTFVLTGAGRRFGLASATAIVGRGHFIDHTRVKVDAQPPPSPETPERYDFDMWFKFLGLRVSYSDKTQLAAVEPGLNASLTYTRSTRDDRHWTGPQYQAALQHTSLFGRHALTPSLLGELDWSNGGNTSAEQHLTRTYDLGAIYEYVLPGDMIFGVERAFVGVVGLRDDDYPQQRTTLSLRYVTSSIIVSLQLSYGPEGLSDQAEAFQTSRLNPL
jgi:hypothetical protein